MYIKSFEINGFRGINHLLLNDLKDINLIIGKNNSCKTSVLEALFLIVGLSNPELIVRINLFRDLLTKENEDLRYIFYNLDYNTKLHLKAFTKDKDNYRELFIKPSYFKSPDTNLEKKAKEIEITSYDTNSIQYNINELLFNIRIKRGKKEIEEYISKMRIISSNIFYELPVEYKESLKGVYISPKISITRNLENELNNIIKNKKEKDIIELLSKIDPCVKNIAFGSNQMIYVDIGIDKLIPLNLIGDGIRRVLAIILSLYNASNGILLIDELENGLFFSNLKLLWKVIIEGTKMFNVQTFITTHNYETLKYLNETINGSDNNTKTRINCITLRKFDDGIIKAYNYDYEKFHFSLSQGIEIR